MLQLTACFTLLLFLFHNGVYAQKYEREYRIKDEQVPAAALEFVEALNFDRKIRWYAEEGASKRSIEAKTRLEKHRYSIEFDTAGYLEDVEVEVDWDQLPAAVLETICSQLTDDFDKFKIIKIQVQYSGDTDALRGLTTAQFDAGKVEVKYELIVKGVEAAKVNWYEYLFAGDGMQEQRLIILFRNTDNLEY